MQSEHQFHYLPEGPEEKLWGVKLLDVGGGAILPGTEYPPSSHPTEYLYSWATGRTLEEHQIVVISQGQGEFESKTGGHFALSAPCLFVLFPGEWHRYRADPQTGWTEHWIGFKGDYAESVLRGFMRAEDPVLRLHEHPSELVSLTQNLLQKTSDGSDKSGIDSILTTLRILGCLHALQIEREAKKNPEQRKIAEARMIILARFNEKLDWNKLAAQLGMSGTTFRRRFLEKTGLPPFQYQTKIRLNRAKTLLATGKRVSEVSDFLGYSSPYHFSNLFREREGISPKAYSQKFMVRPATYQATPNE